MLPPFYYREGCLSNIREIASKLVSKMVWNFTPPCTDKNFITKVFYVNHVNPASRFGLAAGRFWVYHATFRHFLHICKLLETNSWADYGYAPYPNEVIAVRWLVE